VESFESQVTTKTSDTLRVVWRIGEIARMRREAKRLAATLPRYEGDVPLPDAATIFQWIADLCATPHRRPGTPEGHRAEAWVADQLRALGLDNVAVEPIPITVWGADRWSLTVGGETIPSFYVVNTAFTGPDGETAPLVYVGTGTDRDFAGVDVRNKIAVADVPFPYLPVGFLMRVLRAQYCLSDPDRSIGLRSGQYLNFARQNFLGGDDENSAPARDVYWQCRHRGARAICLILRDQPGGTNSHYGPYDGIMKPMPGLWIGKQDGHHLRWAARAGIDATLRLEGTMEKGVTHNVWGVLPGCSDDVILVTSHHDSPFQGATEDGSGAAQVLGQAWAWSHVPREHRPKTLVFVLDAGHFYGSIGAERFAAAHTDLLQRTCVVITLEHLAAKEVEGTESGYAPTGRLAFTVMFTTPEPRNIAVVRRALETKPVPHVAAIPADFFGPGPTSDALKYMLAGNMPVVSWIGCPYYLLDEHDTLDKIDQNQLRPICETATELVKSYMALPGQTNVLSG